jgi:type II secretory pathway pseudopilin PulG
MKLSTLRSRSFRLASFTMVELMVVLGIILILAAVLIGASTNAIKAAKRARAQNMAVQLQTAALGYNTEYSVYPVPGGTVADTLIGDTSAAATSWGNLICILSGNIAPSTGATFLPTSTSPTNSRGIPFLSLKSSDVDANNAPLNPAPTVPEIYFNIAMDSDYNGVLGITGVTSLPNFAASPFNATAANGGGTSTAGVAVWANCNVSTTKTNVNFYVHTY